MPAIACAHALNGGYICTCIHIAHQLLGLIDVHHLFAGCEASEKTRWQERHGSGQNSHTETYTVREIFKVIPRSPRCLPAA